MRRHVRLDERPEPGSRPRSAGGDEHPLLRLQRTAGNQAVTTVVQRDKARKITEEESATWFSSKVAIANPILNYKGKTNATFDGVTLERHWEWGLLADDIAIVFQCGPQRFRFETTRTGGDNFPWRMLNAKGGAGGWADDAVQHALETLYSHWKDPKRFGPASRVVIDALAYDVKMFREKEAEYRAKKAKGMGAAIGSGSTAPTSWWDKYRDSAR